ncbi:MAG TPA: ribonuclease Y [Jatrophihabitantaceae bacterium]|jgi:ribonuclease Y|nr:ribonuclease Y [Jatrophihabitantaceae bacterium]
MNGVGYAAIGAVFVLGLLFIHAYSRRSAAAPGRHSDAGASAAAELGAAESEAEAVRLRAATEADALRRAARTESEATRRAAQSELESARAEAEAARARATRELDARAAALEDEAAAVARSARQLDARRAELDTAETALAARAEELDARETALADKAAELTGREDQLDAREHEHVRELERLAGLTTEQAKAELLSSVEASARRDAAVLVRSIENEARAEGTERARAIVVEAVQRVASEQTSETVVSVLHLPSDEMKGRIIGREGRNIRAFESTTGVNVIIDDTPEAVLLSCFDPVRREIGRLTLDRLILDGRIHPHRIEEAYEQSKAEVDELCLRAARDALAEVGIHDLDERLVPTIGRLKYRTSYGQNVLGHLIETAHIAGVMAAELGIEPTLVKRCAFLHDIGKALTHEVEGSHALIGAALLRKYGEDEAVAHAVEAHHNEVQPRTIEAVLTQASDTCSAARPGARRESLENYVKRLARIEEIANAKEGVEKVFAMQSGREVRVMVQPSEVDDLAASVIAREIAKQIEDELTYPGQIRVTVVRESRATEIAH